jgi:hypothetical protein
MTARHVGIVVLVLPTSDRDVSHYSWAPADLISYMLINDSLIAFYNKVL